MAEEVIHAGMGSDLMAKCGKMHGISGTDQVKLSYIQEQVTCPACLGKVMSEMRQRIRAEVGPLRRPRPSDSGHSELLVGRRDLHCHEEHEID